MPATLDDRQYPGGAADGSDGMDAVAHNGQDARERYGGAKRTARAEAGERQRHGEGEPTRDSPKAWRAWTIAAEWAAGAWMPP